MFVESKKNPGTYYFDDHPPFEKVMNGKVNTQKVDNQESGETPLESPSMNFNEHQMERAGGGRINQGGQHGRLQPAAKETALVQPACV